MSAARPALVIRGGEVVLPAGPARADIAVREERIAAIGDDVGPGDETVDARGLLVLPGLVDSHVHFNEPGRAHWEGWEAGTRGAAAGGVTTVLEMPLNASPPTLTPAAFDEKLAAARRSALVDFGLWGGLVSDNLPALPALHARGVVGFKAFMCDSGIEDFPRAGPDALAAALVWANSTGAVIGVHAERQEIVERLAADLRAAARSDRRAWGASRPPWAELDAIDALLSLAASTRGRVHIVHVSEAAGLASVRRARATGVRATAETCPHYLRFSEDDFVRIGPALKCAPPVRDGANRERLWRGVLTGLVDVIGSDHSPCPATDKRTGDDDVWQAWGGVSGIQATLPVLFTEGVHARGLPIATVARLAATNPAQLFGLSPRKGALVVGADADFALVDPNREWTFGPDGLETRSGISPYLGTVFHGAVVRTIVRGRTVYVDGAVTGEPGFGRLVTPARATEGER